LSKRRRLTTAKSDMPSSANFSIVRTDGFTLRPGPDIDRDFDVTAPDESIGEPCELAFVLDTKFERIGPFDLLTSLHQIFARSFRRQGMRQNLLSSGPRANNIGFRIVEGEGALTITQVVLWFRFPTST
jgi:hypothetical protein